MDSHTRVAGLVSLLAAAALISCGGSGHSSSTSADKGVADADGDVPFEVLKTAIMKANAGDYDEAAEYLELDGPMLEDGFGKAIAPEQTWGRITRGGTVKKIEKVREQYSNQDVSLVYTIHYSNGENLEAHANIRKVNDRWKIRRLNNDNRSF